MTIMKYNSKTIREMLETLSDMADANAYGESEYVQEKIDELRYLLQDEVVH